MGKSIFEFGEMFGYESPFGDWLAENTPNDVVNSRKLHKHGNHTALTVFLNGSNIETNPASGYYFNKDGTYYGGKYGNSDLVSICSKVEFVNQIYYYHVDQRTSINYNDLVLVAGVALAESSYGYSVENSIEVYAIANAILNYYRHIKMAFGTIRNSILDMQAFALTDGSAVLNQFNLLTDEKRNYHFSKEAIGAALNALNDISCIDHSNGATHWDGIDIKKAKWSEGLKFSVPSSDIFSIGDNKKTVNEKYKDKKYYRRKYDYRWIATAGFYGQNTKKKNSYYPYFEGDMINKHKFGTVLMRTSDEYNNILKYGEHKV
jgi:hypothetical protein